MVNALMNGSLDAGALDASIQRFRNQPDVEFPMP
jgi:hypothetical protein